MFSHIVGKNIANLRERQSLTQEALAFFGDMQNSQLGKCERGEGNPKLSTLRRIAVALGVPLSRLFNQGTESSPDYTRLGYFIRDCMPYTWKLMDIYDPLILLDSTGEFLLENVTLGDMDDAVQRYLSYLVYKPITKKFKNEDGQTYYSTGIRLEFVRDEFRHQLDEILDIYLDRKIVTELALLMTKKNLHPEHFRDVVQNFCANEYKVQGL